MASVRIEKLERVIRDRVSEVVAFQVSDPRLGLVTITKVRLAADLSTCRVWWSVLGDGSEKSRTAHALESARGFVQAAVARILRTRRTPRLIFEFDEAVEGSVRVAEIIRRAVAEDEARRGDPPPAPPLPPGPPDASAS